MVPSGFGSIDSDNKIDINMICIHKRSKHLRPAHWAAQLLLQPLRQAVLVEKMPTLQSVHLLPFLELHEADGTWLFHPRRFFLRVLQFFDHFTVRSSAMPGNFLHRPIEKQEQAEQSTLYTQAVKQHYLGIYGDASFRRHPHDEEEGVFQC